MRASTLFAVVLAILLGLGVAAGVKYSGILDRAPAEPPPRELPKVLVAAQNLFEGMVIKPDDVKVRTMEPEEEEDWKRNRDKYMPALPEAAVMRVLARNVEAGMPIKREFLEEQGLPKSLGRRIDPNMRAVNLSLPKQQAGGGLIQVGERVDVYLTTQISQPGHPAEAAIETAPIARDLRVIVKRDMLWNALMPVPEDRPVKLTLEANPYRAALIEFSKTRGELTLVPTAAGPQDKAGGRRPAPAAVKAANLEGKEWEDEDKRVNDFLAGTSSVGDVDLERIFNLAPPPVRLKVERYDGVTAQTPREFEVPAETPGAIPTVVHHPLNHGRPSLGYVFRNPAVRDTGGGTSDELTLAPQTANALTAVPPGGGGAPPPK
jgi:Flp pilus assembly protein CpaB